MFTHYPFKQRTPAQLALVFGPLAVGTILLFINHSIYSSETFLPTGNTLGIIGTVLFIGGLVIELTDWIMLAMKNKFVPAEFKERDEREQQVTAAATRSVYVMTQLIFFELAIILPIVFQYQPFVSLLSLVLIGQVALMSLLFWIFVRKGYRVKE